MDRSRITFPLPSTLRDTAFYDIYAFLAVVLLSHPDHGCPRCSVPHENFIPREIYAAYASTCAHHRKHASKALPLSVRRRWSSQASPFSRGPANSAKSRTRAGVACNVPIYSLRFRRVLISACPQRAGSGWLGLGAWFRPIIRSLTMDAAKTIAQAFISCCLDYCNSLLYGISDSLLQRLQSVQMLQHVLSLARGGVIISSQFFFSCTGYQSASDFISRLPAGFTGHWPAKDPSTLPTTVAWYQTRTVADSALLTLELVSPPERLRDSVTKVFQLLVLKFGTVYRLHSGLWTWSLTVTNEDLRPICLHWCDEISVPSDLILGVI